MDCNINLHKALKYRGIPYKYGGLSVKGVDCSGLVCLVANKNVSKRLLSMRSAVNMFRRLKSIKTPVKGDLVFFSWHGKKVDHVGIIVNKKKFIHSSSSRGVIVDNISTYSRNIVGYRKV